MSPAASGSAPALPDDARAERDALESEPPSAPDEVRSAAAAAPIELATGEPVLPAVESDPPGAGPVAPAEGSVSPPDRVERIADGPEPLADSIERSVAGRVSDAAAKPELAAPTPTTSSSSLQTTGPVTSATVPNNGGAHPVPAERQAGCTTAQLRRFIKSRAYVPMHEIRRRFLIATEDDDVSGIDLETRRIFVGLPPREGQMLGELLRGGEVGYELQLDPVAPIVVGVYPMRPVSRG
jgi:hypothetical protein